MKYSLYKKKNRNIWYFRIEMVMFSVITRFVSLKPEWVFPQDFDCRYYPGPKLILMDFQISNVNHEYIEKLSASHVWVVLHVYLCMWFLICIWGNEPLHVCLTGVHLSTCPGQLNFSNDMWKKYQPVSCDRWDFSQM